MGTMRRELLKLASFGLAGATVSASLIPGARAQATTHPASNAVYDARAFGAAGDGTTIDSPAINRAIDTAAAAGGGTVYIGAGTYACYSIHLRSYVALYLGPGATVLAASTPREGVVAGGYDVAESNAPWEPYQDFGHNHWHNSLIWGEDIHDVAIHGPGLIWGRGLSRGHDDKDLPPEEAPGAANKAIALKKCHNVVLRDFSILAGGHFGILATGVDNLTVDNLKIDTNRDGMNIDCCRNVRISNCSVNSPWDDGICPKSSFALGYPRATENVTITSCYITGNYRMGTLLDGTFKPINADLYSRSFQPTGRIKFGTESNGGFKNISVANCVFESCRGFALESVDGATVEDITISGITMRDIRNAPFFLRLGARMRGPREVPVGTLKRVLINNVTCFGPANDMPSIISGIPGHVVEDVKISDVYVLQKGGGTSEMAALQPAEQESEYPEPVKLGPLPAQHFFIRHARNLEFTNVEIATAAPDSRPVFWLTDVDGASFFRMNFPRDQAAPSFLLNNVWDFEVFGSRGVKDVSLDSVTRQRI
jgi:polygalacturonase